MNFRYKFVLLITLVLSTILMATNSINAGWWEANSIPVPPGTQEANKETRRISGSEFEFIYYTSTQDIDALKQFYRLRLPQSGWKEKELAKDMGQLQGVQIDTGMLNKTLENNIMFEKEGETLMISFMPAGFSQDGRTKFTVSKGKLSLEKAPSSDDNLIPELLTKPKKEVAPEYPGAKLVSLSEQQSSTQATYMTKDDIEGAISFYKSQMPGYGWSLAGEEPVTKADYGDTTKYDISQYCPTCPKDTLISPGSISTWTAQLKFSNAKGDGCRVFLSQTQASGKASSALNMTTIVMYYEEAK